MAGQAACRCSLMSPSHRVDFTASGCSLAGSEGRPGPGVAASRVRYSSARAGRLFCRCRILSWWRSTMISRSFECPERTAKRANDTRNRYRTRHMGPQDRECRTCSARYDRVSATHGSQDAAHHAWSAHTTAFSGTHTYPRRRYFAVAPDQYNEALSRASHTLWVREAAHSLQARQSDLTSRLQDAEELLRTLQLSQLKATVVLSVTSPDESDRRGATVRNSVDVADSLEKLRAASSFLGVLRYFERQRVRFMGVLRWRVSFLGVLRSSERQRVSCPNALRNFVPKCSKSLRIA